MCMFCRSLFVLCTFSFGHCVICSSSIYGFWLPLWLASNSSSHPVFGGVRVAHLFSFPALWCFYKTFELFSFPRLLSMSVLDEECHRNALNYISASLSTMPMLRFESFQLCHGKIKSQLRCFFIKLNNSKVL
jgi:hypothetical protein